MVTENAKKYKSKKENIWFVPVYRWAAPKDFLSVAEESQ